MRPRFFIDIKKRGLTPYSRVESRLNFSAAKILRIRGYILARTIAFSAAALYLFFGLALAPIEFRQIFAQTSSDDERAALEKQLGEVEEQIAQYEATVSNYKRQGKTLQGEIDRLNAKVRKLNLQLKSIETSITRLNQEIAENKGHVAVAENRLNFQRGALASTLQNIYEKEDEGFFEIILRNPRFSNFVRDVNNLLAFQDNLRLIVENVERLRDELLEKQESLAIKKSDAEELRAYQHSQKLSIQNVKSEKDQLLTITKGQESRYQELLKETKKTAAQIRSQIFQFLGGGELSFEEAYKFAKVAEAATGVRAALILAVLDKESAFGQNVGRCSYKTAMHPRRDQPLFLALTSELGINPDTVTVSCPNRDGAYGGAMGPGQFIPSTWNLYSARVTDITGNRPASPWRNGDAFVGTALYLKDAGAYKGATITEERKAAARYYAGSRWQRYLWTYGDRVVNKAKQFQQDIDILNS